VERVEEIVPVQEVADLMGAGRAVVADDTDGLERPTPEPPPVVEELADRS